MPVLWAGAGRRVRYRRSVSVDCFCTCCRVTLPQNKIITHKQYSVAIVAQELLACLLSSMPRQPGQQSRSGAPEHAASERGTAIAKAATDHGMAVQTQTASSNLKWEHRKKYPERYPEGCYDKDWINNRWRNAQRSRTEITHSGTNTEITHRDHTHKPTHTNNPRAFLAPGPRLGLQTPPTACLPFSYIYIHTHIDHIRSHWAQNSA